MGLAVDLEARERLERLGYLEHQARKEWLVKLELMVPVGRRARGVMQENLDVLASMG
jgi:hypothetical protein